MVIQDFSPTLICVSRPTNWSLAGAIYIKIYDNLVDLLFIFLQCPSVGLLLGQRRRHWPNIKPITLYLIKPKLGRLVWNTKKGWKRFNIDATSRDDSKNGLLDFNPQINYGSF